MKDPGGHGSNSKLTSSGGGASPMPHFTPKSGGNKGQIGVKSSKQPVPSNAEAAQALMSTLKSTQAPIHPAMAARQAPADGGG